MEFPPALAWGGALFSCILSQQPEDEDPRFAGQDLESLLKELLWRHPQEVPPDVQFIAIEYRPPLPEELGLRHRQKAHYAANLFREAAWARRGPFEVRAITEAGGAVYKRIL